MKKKESEGILARMGTALNTDGKTKRQKGILFFIVFSVLSIAGICLGIISLYFSAGLYSKQLLMYYMEQPGLVILNTLPYMLLCYFVWFLTNRPWAGFLAGGAVCLVYSFAEYWKLLSRDDPVYAEDLAVLKEALQMSRNYITITPVMVLSVCLVVGGVIILALLFHKTRIFPGIIRLCASMGIAALSGVLYFTVYTSEEIYNSFTVWEPLNAWFDNNKYISRGGIYPFIYSIQSAASQQPEGYHVRAAEDMLTEYETDDIPEDKKANVIFVMLEAFCDLSEETDLITEGDPYEAYHRLKEESYSGKLVTNVFAGGTINTERCVLTGFSELTNFRRKSWSYVRYFADQGYSVTGSHGGNQAFYSRNTVNRNLGFDDYYFLENYYNKFGDDVTMDWYLLPEITQICLDRIQQGEDVFSFNVTYQNHGPYDTTLWESRVPYVAEGTVSDSDYGIINNYLNGIADTGSRLLTMADSFRDLEEPVILVFFGDHKPWLGDSSGTYAALGIDIVSGTEESVYNRYETDYVIWANDAAKDLYGIDFAGEGPSISPCYLMNVLFDLCGWEGPSYLKFTDEVMEVLPIMTTNGYYNEGSGLIEESELSDIAAEQLAKMRQIQYYLANDSGGELPTGEG